MIPVNFTTATLLHVSRAWMLACLSSLPGGCGPVSHSCTMHGKLKIYNIFMVCFHLRLVLDCSEWSRMFYVPSLLAYFGMFMWLSFCPFLFDLSFFFFFFCNLTFQRHTVPLLLSCVLPSLWVTSCQAHCQLQGTTALSCFVLFFCLKQESLYEVDLLKMTHTSGEVQVIPVQYWFESGSRSRLVCCL